MTARGPSPRAAYGALMTAFGPRGWWPVSGRRGGPPAYHPGRFPRLTEAQRFEIAAGAILTQNTSWSNVAKALEGLRGAGALEPRRLARMPATRLEALVRPSGYFRQKALKLKRFSEAALARGGLGTWLAGPLERTRGELLEVWGVGPETADSILLYAGGRPVFVVDAYTTRAGRRLGLPIGESYEATRAYFEAGLPRSARLYQEFHALWVELGKRHCGATPQCPGCPLERNCAYAKRSPSPTLRAPSPTGGRGPLNENSLARLRERAG